MESVPNNLETIGWVLTILMSGMILTTSWLIRWVSKVDKNLTQINTTMKLEKEAFGKYQTAIKDTLKDHGKKLDSSGEKITEISRRVAIMESSRT